MDATDATDAPRCSTRKGKNITSSTCDNGMERTLHCAVCCKLLERKNRSMQINLKSKNLKEIDLLKDH